MFVEIYAPKVAFSVCIANRKDIMEYESAKEKLFMCLFIESYEVSNDTVMIRLQKDTYGRDFNLESASLIAWDHSSLILTWS